MDKYYRAFKEIKGNRDVVFKAVLDYFNHKPIDILEIGCARNLDISSRQSDGWSSCFWADYVCENGGFLDIYDISKASTDNCRELISTWLEKPEFDHSYDIEINNREFSFDTEYYNLIFLDGGDDPKETLKQYTFFNGHGIVLIDDFYTKGSLIVDEPDTLWEWENGHRMACFGGPKLGLVKLKLL